MPTDPLDREKLLELASKKVAFTFRLDGERHLRLRLACVITGRSAQQLATDALDAMLSNMPEIDALVDARVVSLRALAGDPR